MNRTWKDKLGVESFKVTTIFILLIILINGLDLLANNGLVLANIRDVIFSDAPLVDLFLFPFRISDNWLSLALFLYFYWVFGSQLELEMTSFYYTLYLLSAELVVLSATLIYPLSSTYAFFSIFLALAWRKPDNEIWLFFVLPIRLKWAALISFLVPCGLAYYYRNHFPLVGPVLSLFHFGLLHLKEILRGWKKWLRK